MGIRLKITLALVTPLLVLTSCQVPGSISLDPVKQPVETKLASSVQVPVGLDGPTWDAIATGDSRLAGWKSKVQDTYTRVETSKKVVAITFDDGPHVQNTPRLLDMLKKRGIKATFYVVGNMVKYNPQLLRRMIAEGHEIGNHTMTHATLTRLSDDALRKELQIAHDMILKETGVAPMTMRPPGGAINKAQKKLMLEEFGYPTILWSVDPEDWKKPGVSIVTSRLVNGAGPGGILLAHDLHKSTVDAMPDTLDQLLRRGFKFVTVTELILMDEREPEKKEIKLPGAE